MTILKRYKCIKSNDERRFTVGEIYPLYKGYKGYKNYIVANNNVNWYENEVPIIEKEYGVELAEMEDVKSNTAEPMYTPCDVNKVIIKAYQTYNNDAQRLAFIKGYFAK